MQDFWEWVNFPWSRRGFDGKKGRNGIRLMVEPEMFDMRFFLDQERKQQFHIPKFSGMGQQSSGKSQREEQKGRGQSKTGHGSNLPQNFWIS